MACRLDKRDREELEARAETLTTTVGELVERYVLAGLRVDRSVVSGSATPINRVWKRKWCSREAEVLSY